MREISSLLNAEVISIQEGKRLGVISQVGFDLSKGTLLGVILGKGAAEKGIRAGDIKTWGPDVVMVEDSQVAGRLSEIPELMETRRDPTRPPQQVVTDAGQRLGRLGRVYLDPVKLEVMRFEISGGAWRDLTEGVLSMPVVKGIIHGPDTIIVPAKAVAQATESAGLKTSVEKAAGSVRGEVAGGAKRLGEMVESSAEAVKKTLATPIGKPGAKPPEEPPPAKPKAAKPKAAKPKAAKPKAAKPAAKAPARKREPKSE